MKTHDFKKSIILGNKGEEIILDYIKNLDTIKNITDLRNIKIYQNKDIDCTVLMKDKNKYSIEIKTDTYKTGNIFYETMSCVETNSIGCMEKTEADFLFYYFINTNELYILKMKEYRQWFNLNKNKFTKKIFKNKRYDGSLYTSVGFTIPKIFLENNFKNYKKKLLLN